jgi:3-dehydroquinate dehydratase-2
MKIIVINGPNLNLLGKRQPEIYGSMTLADIEAGLIRLGRELGIEVGCLHSNSEGTLVDHLQEAGRTSDGIILNAAAYTHTSVALRDAVLCCPVPVVEVHLSQPAAREAFRHTSLLAGACAGSIAGFGAQSYALALWWFSRRPSSFFS